jgi:amino acid transporter
MILHDQLGTFMERTLLVVIAFAFFGAGLVTLATCSRMIYAMSRDDRFPAHQLMRRVNPRTQTPIPATILPVVLGFILMAVVPGDALLELLTVGGVIGASLYGAIVLLYLGVRKRLGRQEDAFDIGRFEMPVAIAALVWSVVVVFILVAPHEARTAVLISIGILLLGGVYFAYLYFARRDVLESEPGEMEAFKH